MHLVAGGTGAGRLTTGRYARRLVVPGGEKGACLADRKIRLPLGLGCVGIAVQLKWRAKGHTTGGLPDVIDVTGVAAVFLSIDEANYVVERGRLTPAHVPPVSGAVVHGAEEARTATARADEGRAGVGISKSDTAVSRAIHDVSPVAPAAGTTAITAVFVHAGDVHVARNLVSSDLDVSDEDGPSGNREVHRRTPSDTVIGRAHNRDGGPSKIEVVEGNIHSPEERRGWVVVSITRFPVVKGVAVSAKMSPASRVRGIGGLVSADALTAARHVKIGSEPSAGWSVVQSNGVAQGIGEGALAGLTGWSVVGTGDAGEGGAAVGGDRWAGDVDGAGIATA